MIAQDIVTAAELREAAEDPLRLSQIEHQWRKVSGQKSGVTWHYAQILAGIPGVKPDRMIIRFVADTLGLPRNSVSTDFAGDAVRAAAAELSI